MRIGLIAPPWVPVPPPSYGGTELVIDLLARGLQERGHDVTLFATGDSTCPVPRLWEYPEALSTHTTDNHQVQVRQITSAYRQLTDMDLIHDHTALGPSLQSVGIPVVATMHGIMDEPTRQLCRSYPDNVTLVAISASQRSSAPELDFGAVIHHGIDVSSVPFGTGTGGYLVFLGRMSPSKGVHTAIDIAQESGMPLVIAAKMCQESEFDYFRERIEGRLGADISFIGEAGLERKSDLLADAVALLNPMRWQEPFGLVMIESMAAGTPVIATPMGAAPEIIDPGHNGFLFSTAAQGVAACAKAGDLSREACRQSVTDRFSADRMVRDHEMLFEALLRERIVVRPDALHDGDERRNRSRGLFARREPCPGCGLPLTFTVRHGLVNLICEDCHLEWHRELGVLYPVSGEPEPTTRGRQHLPSLWWGSIRHPQVKRSKPLDVAAGS